MKLRNWVKTLLVFTAAASFFIGASDITGELTLFTFILKVISLPTLCLSSYLVLRY